VKINTYALVAMLSFALAVTPCGATTMTALAVKQQSDKQGWAQLMQSGEPCDASKAPDAMCALAAITLASGQCAADARFFQRQRSGLSNLSLALILVSAAFTGVGASSTIANAKIYSTLGGTTGIGAATTTLNSDVSSDQSSLTAITTSIGKLETLGSAYNSSDANAITKILLQAPAIAAECAAAAATSSNAAKPAS
jgi:hypothetical protein